MPEVTGMASAQVHMGTMTNQASYIDYIVPDHQHQLGMRIAPILAYHMTLVEASLFRLTGWFQYNLCYASKLCIPSIILKSHIREIHPLELQRHRHSMLVPRVCAPRVTRCSLGLLI